MRKYLFMAAIAALFTTGLTSCSNDEGITGKQETKQDFKEINFNLSDGQGFPSTRASESTVETLQGAGVGFYAWGFDGTSAYMGGSTTGVHVTYATNKWDYTPKQYWPTNGNKLKFMAATPIDYGTYAATSASIVWTGTIPECATQKDLMFAKNDGTGDGINFSGTETKIDLAFDHALSEIVFEGILENNAVLSKATVKEIGICNVNNSGTITFAQAGTITPSAQSGSAIYTPVSDASVEVTAKEGQDPAQSPVALCTASQALMLMPQDITAWDGEAKTEDVPTSGTYIRVKAQIKNNSDVEIVSDANYYYIPVPTITWEPGHKYVYKIKFTASSLTPIEFGSVTVNAWPTTGTNYHNEGPIEF